MVDGVGVVEDVEEALDEEGAWALLEIGASRVVDLAVVPEELLEIVALVG